MPVAGTGSAGTHVERHGDLGSLERLARALLLLGLHGPDHDALEGCVRVRSRLWLRLRVMYDVSPRDLSISASPRKETCNNNDGRQPASLSLQTAP